MSENNVVVIDPGSLVLKAGYGGEDTPSVTINNAIGFSKEQEEKDNFLCGEELQAKKEALSIKYPVVDGIVTNIDDFEKILQYVFDNELKITPEENNILLSESIVNPKPIREKMGQILFETFNSLSVYIAAQPLLALYSAGCTTGVVVDIGDGICHTTPFNEGYVVHSGVYNTSLSGKKLTEYLSELLAQKGNYNINIEKIREIKEELCFTSFDYEEQTRKMGLKSNDIDRNYVLPDGQVINLGVERFKCAELLFKPQLFGIESIGIHETIYNSLASCDPETRSEVAQHSTFLKINSNLLLLLLLLLL